MQCAAAAALQAAACSACACDGDGEIRTHDPLLARQVLSQLSYTPSYDSLFIHICNRRFRLPLFARIDTVIYAPNGTAIYAYMRCLFFKKRSGGLLLSRAVSSTVPSAGGGLTIVFGMGTGVSPFRIATGGVGLLFC